MNKYINICKLFEMRCKNIICKDIRIAVWNENSTKTEIVNSNYMYTMYLKLYLFPNIYRSIIYSSLYFTYYYFMKLKQ